MTMPVVQPGATRITLAGDAPDVLSSMGLSLDVLQGALASGELGAGNTTKYHPRISAGTTRWADTVARLRSELVELKWNMAEPKNSPRIVSPDGRISIMVVGGNPLTGIESGEPRTARKRGPSTKDAVEANQLSLPFDLAGLTKPGDLAASSDAATWVLLYYRSDTPNETRAELSLPESISDGEIKRWHHRILLPAVTHNLAVVTRDAGGNDDVDFKIDPR